MSNSQLVASSENQQKAIDAFLEVDVLFLGGAMFGGKSFLAAMLSTLYATNPESRMAVFRTTLQDMKKGGAIIDTFKGVYKLIGDECKLKVTGNPPVGKIIAGEGAGSGLDDCCKIDFIQMRSDSDMESIRGSAFNFALIEEAIPDFTREQIEMILSRLRIQGGNTSQNALGSKLLITGNPHPDHFLCSIIQDHYLDAEGYAIPERSGDIRYFFNFQGEYIWGDSKGEVYQKVDDLGGYVVETIPLSKEERLERILAFSFVQLTIKDNPIGRKNNPGYMAKLEAMDPIKKARNLFGNWFIRPQNSTYFDRTWLRGVDGNRVKRLDEIPKGCVAIRGVDRAITEPHEGNTSPNYTAFSPLVLRDSTGSYYLVGNYHEECIDKPYNRVDKPVKGRIRRNPGERNNLIVKQCLLDKQLADEYGYSSPKVAIAEDSGANKADFSYLRAELEQYSISVVKDVKPSNTEGKKLNDFMPFSAACQDRRVYIVEQSFPKDTLEAFYKELEVFDGEKGSTRTRFDDWVDAVAIAFHTASTTRKPYTSIPLEPVAAKTLSANLYK